MHLKPRVFEFSPSATNIGSGEYNDSRSVRCCSSRRVVVGNYNRPSGSACLRCVSVCKAMAVVLSKCSTRVIKTTKLNVCSVLCISISGPVRVQRRAIHVPHTHVKARHLNRGACSMLDKLPFHRKICTSRHGVLECTMRARIAWRSDSSVFGKSVRRELLVFVVRVIPGQLAPAVSKLVIAVGVDVPISIRGVDYRAPSLAWLSGFPILIASKHRRAVQPLMTRRIRHFALCPKPESVRVFVERIGVATKCFFNPFLHLRRTWSKHFSIELRASLLTPVPAVD